MALNVRNLFDSVHGLFRHVHHGAKRHISFFTLELIILIVLGVTVMLFMANILQGTVVKILDARLAIVQQQRRIGALSDLRQGFAKVQSDLPTLYTLLTTEEALGETITQLDALADSFALNVQTQIGGQGNDGDIKYIPITITTTGNLDTLQRYLLALEQLPFLMNVQSLNLGGSLNQPVQVILQAQLYIR